jgi:hypothetical protein
MRSDPGRTGADATGEVKTKHTASTDPVDTALAAIGFAIDIRDVSRRLDELLDGAP